MNKLIIGLSILMISVSCLASPRYFVNIKIKQTHFTIDIIQHMKDSANAINLTIPVDCEFYNSVQNGQILVKSFRGGSLVLGGSIGNWNVSVADKFTK